jgi:hypothetical protein
MAKNRVAIPKSNKPKGSLFPLPAITAPQEYPTSVSIIKPTIPKILMQIYLPQERLKMNKATMKKPMASE